MRTATRIILRGLGDEKGIAALEFAMIFPILMGLYLGIVATSQALGTYRKLTDATVEAANVASQYAAMQPGDPALILGAASQIMTPISTAPFGGVMSLVTTNAAKTAKVTWSCAYNGATPLAQNATFPLPANMAQANTAYLVVQTAYAFSPSFGAAQFPATTMSDQAIILPRLSTTVPLSGGC